MPDSIQDRLVAVERLTKLFKAERMVHLGVTSVALVMLLASAAVLLSTRHAGLLALIFLRDRQPHAPTRWRRWATVPAAASVAKPTAPASDGRAPGNGS